MTFKEFLQIRREDKYKEKLKSRLLAKGMDYAYLEDLVQRVNNNPRLRITIKLNDGTVLELKTYNPMYNTETTQYAEEVIQGVS